MPMKNARKKFIEGGIYHVYNRGVNKQPIFFEDKDFNIFKAKCCRSDVFNPEIGLEICCKKRKINIFENEKEKKAKEVISLERMIKDLKEGLGKY